MSTKCTVEGCGKWSFQGGLCRGHTIGAPQAAAPKTAAAAAALASAPKQPSSSPWARPLTGPGTSGAICGQGGGGSQQAVVSISSKNAYPPSPPPHIKANTVTLQQDEPQRDAVDPAVQRQAFRDDHRRGEEERTRLAMEFLSLHACVRRGCTAIRLPQSMVFDNPALQAQVDATVAGACHYHSQDTFVARDPSCEWGSEAVTQWACCGKLVFLDKGGCMLAPGHEFPAQGVRTLHQPWSDAVQLAVAVFDSVAAGQGDAEAQFRLGQLHSTVFPNGCAPNPLFDMATAAKFYRLAAAQAHVTALRRLGDLHAEGKGVERDEAEAAKCYRSAADKGDAHAQFNLGVMLEEGRGVQRDELEAVRLYKAAIAQHRHSAANHRLGYIAAFSILQDGSQVLDAGALADMLGRLGVKCAADLARKNLDYNGLKGIAKLLKPAAAHAAFSFTGHQFPKYRLDK
jgi:TPR repeat protein